MNMYFHLPFASSGKKKKGRKKILWCFTLSTLHFNNYCPLSNPTDSYWTVKYIRTGQQQKENYCWIGFLLLSYHCLQNSSSLDSVICSDSIYKNVLTLFLLKCVWEGFLSIKGKKKAEACSGQVTNRWRDSPGLSTVLWCPLTPSLLLTAKK